jgi:cytochrome c biogenesis protein CcmG, thiol:disulfide interchange protein DsbE
MNRRWVLWIPLLIIAFFGGIFLYGLRVPHETVVRSAMVGRKLPEFVLPPATPGVEGLSTRQAATGKPHLLNIFASWCIPCRAEAPQLDALKRAGVQIDAIAVKDKPDDVAAFLKQYGNPFARIGADLNMQVQVDLGSSGVPETYVIGADGTILYQHIGDIRSEHVPMLLAKLRDAQ